MSNGITVRDIDPGDHLSPSEPPDRRVGGKSHSPIQKTESSESRAFAQYLAGSEELPIQWSIQDHRSFLRKGGK